MPEDPPNPDGLLARRLDHLFRTVHPAARKAYTPAEVATAMNEAADERVTSGTYLWQLRTGRKDNPTYKVLMGLASFFGVSPTYFFEDTAVERWRTATRGRGRPAGRRRAGHRPPSRGPVGALPAGDRRDSRPRSRAGRGTPPPGHSPSAWVGKRTLERD
jgi:transcriptional regulator with XRE-family HTH domain